MNTYAETAFAIPFPLAFFDLQTRLNRVPARFRRVVDQTVGKKQTDFQDFSPV